MPIFSEFFIYNYGLHVNYSNGILLYMDLFKYGVDLFFLAGLTPSAPAWPTDISTGLFILNFNLANLGIINARNIIDGTVIGLIFELICFF